MLDRTRRLWEPQDRHPGDRRRLFEAVADSVPAETVLYPGSYVDLAASFVWPSVTYVDVDRRAAQFFADTEGVRELLAEHGVHPDARDVRFVHGDVAMAALDPTYRLRAVVISRDGRYAVSTRDLDSYLVPKREDAVTRDSLHRSGRGVAYTRSAYAYLFEHVGSKVEREAG